jgi:hypothetical protein
VKYQVRIDGFQDQCIELDPPNMLWKRGGLFLNGLPVPKNLKGQFLLQRTDGQKVIATMRNSFFGDAPCLEVEGRTIRVVPPLPLHQYMLSCLPLLWIVMQGVGLIIGVALMIASIRIFRSRLSPRSKYLFVILLGILFPLTWGIAELFA